MEIILRIIITSNQFEIARAILTRQIRTGYMRCTHKCDQEEKEDLEREVARLKEGGGEQTRLEELMEVERELKQANKTIQQQVSYALLYCI